MSRQPLLDNLAGPAKAGIPVPHVCGSADPYLQDHTRAAEQRYLALGGKMKVIIQEGAEHYPLSPADPAAAVAFILESLSQPQGQ